MRGSFTYNFQVICASFLNTLEVQQVIKSLLADNPKNLS